MSSNLGKREAMKRKSKNYRLIVNNTAAKKHPSPESSGSDEYTGPPPSRNHRQVRKHKQRSNCSDDLVCRTKNSHAESTACLVRPLESDKVSSSNSRVHKIDESSHHHHRRNVKISVREKSVERRVASDTCHRVMEPRGYQPFTEPELSRNAKSPCMSTGEASPCREHIYRPVKEQNRRCNDDFIIKLKERCEDDKKRACDLDRRPFVNDQSEGSVEMKCNEAEKQANCNIDQKGHQAIQCNNEAAQLKKSIRHHEIKVISTCKKAAADYKIFVREKRENTGITCKEQETHLFPFQKSSAGLLKINPSMICYQDGKMCLLVADHSKTRIQFKSTLADVNRKAKSNHCIQNEQPHTPKCTDEVLVVPTVDCTETKTKGHYENITVRDCHDNISKRYSNIQNRL